MIKVLDNFLSKENHRLIISMMKDPSFPWSYIEGTVYSSNNSKNLYDYQFVHMFYNNNTILNSHSFQKLMPLFYALRATVLVRAKANLRPFSDKIIQSEMHVDIDYKDIEMRPEVMGVMKTAIYYLNTNNGYTLFAEGTKVESIENRVVIFPSNLMHAGTTCTNEKSRIVLNINYF